MCVTKTPQVRHDTSPHVAGLDRRPRYFDIRPHRSLVLERFVRSLIIAAVFTCNQPVNMLGSPTEQKIKVFISYSRRDSAGFVDELAIGLELAKPKPPLSSSTIVDQ